MKYHAKQLLNTPIEIGMRCLIILTINIDRHFDLERLTYYDYICTRLNDYNKDFESLHPTNPYRRGELLVKRELLKKGLLLLAKKDLIRITLNSDGILYTANEYSKHFLDHFNSQYYKKFTSHTIEASKILSNTSTENLREFFKTTDTNIIEKYSFESIVRGE